MPKDIDITNFLDEILSLLNNYKSGDLLSIAGMIEKLEEAGKHLSDITFFNQYPDFIKILCESLKVMTIDLDIEEKVILLISNIILLLKQHFNNSIEQNLFKNNFDNDLNELKKCLESENEDESTLKESTLKENTIDELENKGKKDLKENTIDKAKNEEKKELKEKDVKEGSNFYNSEYFNNIVDDPKLLAQFYDEANEHLDQAQLTLVELEYDSNNQELINNTFRNFHTIKGSSAFLGLKNIESVSHKIEDLFDLVRKEKISITKELIDVIFYGMNLIKTILDTMNVNNFNKNEMKKSFELINIFDYLELMDKILKGYKTKKIGELLIEFNKISFEQLQEVLKKQKESPEKKTGEILVEEKVVKEEDISIALQKQNELKLKKKKTGYVKVSNERLNVLIDIVGELVTNQSMLKQQIIQNNIRDQNIERSLTDFETITTTIKNIVLSMGMSPIEEIFNKLKVVARNTSNDLGKVAFVEIEGGETELDRNVMETIYDPLLHIIRNAIDHGIEYPEEREKKGKNKIGRILLKAEHKGSGIEISVTDDGKGIDKSKIIEKAIQMKLINNKEDITEKEIYNFLFLPGFSTSEKITMVSGRGVGLDVVKKNIDSIHGRVEIQSELNKGTTFTIKLPLTLAIIEGFVTKVNLNKYVFPFNLIEEILVLEKEKILTNKERKSSVIYHRGYHIPVIFLQKNFSDIIEEKKDYYISIIINFNQERYCIVVDEIIGKQEIVIKNLSSILNENKIFSGGTIFGDGTIGFVIDMQGLLDSLNKEIENIIK